MPAVFVSEKGELVSISVIQLLQADCGRLIRSPGVISSSESSESNMKDVVL